MKPIHRLCLLITVLFTVSNCERVLASSSKPTQGAAITNISVPETCVQGDTVPIVVSVENRGDQQHTCEIILTDRTEGREIGRKSVTLSETGKAGIDEICDLVFESPVPGKQYFGYPPACGDVNGDGYDDLLITASQWNEAMGRAYLYYGGKNMDTAPDFIFTGEGAGDLFGDGGAALGDINGDGYDDVLVGAPGFSGGTEDGRVYIFYGGPHMDDNADLILDGESGGRGYFGLMIVTGDVNGDKYEDVVVTAVKMNSWKGSAYLYYGGSRMDNQCDLKFGGENPNDWFGRYAAMGGDVNGDRYPDLLIGARRYPNDHAKGRAYLFYGGNRMDSICDKIFTGKSDYDDFSTVAIIDIDNDGFDDVAAGSRKYHAGQCQGRVYLYWGGTEESMDVHADKVFTGEADPANATFGSFICGADINKDGYGDLMFVGYDYCNFDQRGQGCICYGGTRTSMDEVADWMFIGGSPGSQLNRIAVGDVNGDGYDDVVIGGYAYNNGQGRVWLFYNTPSCSANLTFDWDTDPALPGEHLLEVKVRLIGVDWTLQSDTKTLVTKTEAVRKNAENDLGPGDYRGSEEVMEIVKATDHGGVGIPSMSFTNAAVYGDIDQIQLHLLRMADIDERTISGDTTLHYAIKYRHRDVAELLIAHGADINGPNRDGETLVHLAIKADQKEVLDLLLTKGATVSPVHLAAFKGDLATVRKFVEGRTSVNADDEGGLTLLHAAACGRQREVAAYLISKGAEVNIYDKKKQTPLFCAASLGHRSVVELLIDKGAALNPEREPDRWTPLYAAVEFGHEDIVDLLITRGSNVNLKTLTGNTALHVAALKGDRGSAELLIAKGADLNVKNARWLNAPLHLAVVAGYRDIVELLVSKQADLNVRNTDGFSPLHYAVSSRSLSGWERRIGESSTPNDLSITELLITHGADVNLKSDNGATPLSLARRRGKAEIVELLKKHGAKE